MTYYLGLGGPYHHDGSACLLDELGNIVAFTEEERFSRRKHNRDSRSCGAAAAFCLSVAGIELSDVSTIAVAWNPGHPHEIAEISDGELLRELLPPRFFGGHEPASAIVVDHHRAHAASAFYASGLQQATVIVVDGHGDGRSTSVHAGDRVRGLREVWHADPSQSLGWLYESASAHVGLGDWSGAGKLMGLAGYGSPSFEPDFLTIGDEEPYRIDVEELGLRAPGVSTSGDELLDFYASFHRALSDRYRSWGVDPATAYRKYDPARGELTLDHQLPAAHLDLAASAQGWLETALDSLVRFAVRQTGIEDVCYAGGTALNCAANGVLRRGTTKGSFFIQPVASDAGCALGAAYEALTADGLVPSATPMRETAFGAGFTPDGVRHLLDRLGARYSEPKEGVAVWTAKRIAEGSVVGWVQGRAEAGPRALGHRSILGNPQTAETRDFINRAVKRREPWRPLAPSVLQSDAELVVDRPSRSDFMIEAFVASDWAKAHLPAVVHVDGTIRPQFVDRAIDPGYAGLLDAVRDELGVGAVLNTSFNGEDEPIVNNPFHALAMLHSSPMDAMAIGPYAVVK
jgi:carbamoyltransferase